LFLEIKRDVAFPGGNVPLQVDVRRLGEVTLLKCKGRIVAGDESNVLQRHVTDLMDSERQFVLHLGDVTFVDSSGLGLLVRLAGVTRAAHGDIKLCSVGREVSHALTITNLKQVLEMHSSEVEAVAAFYQGGRNEIQSTRLGEKLLCIDESEDVLALLRELLRQAGFSPVTTSNVFDARILVKATKPAIVVIGPGVSQENRRAMLALIGSTPFIALESTFGSLEAAEAAEFVVSAIREKLAKN
jgi:anti-sigma B factor antagonist